MFTVKVSFSRVGKNASVLIEAAQGLLACWYKNGQIVADWVLAEGQESFDAYATLPEADSLAIQFNNSYANSALSELGDSAPTVSVLGTAPDREPVCSCSQRSGLVLFTHYLSNVPPVRCLDCFCPIPLYRLPHVHDEEHLVLLHWAADYRACDTLQMHTTVGERFGEEQLFDHESALSKAGRGLCSQLEQAVGLPVYYYLHKTRSRGRESELARTCPSCGATWRLQAPLHLFDFRCDHCRLLSAVSADAS